MTQPFDEGRVVPEGVAAEPPQWQERDAWTALDDLDVSPVLVPASEWPAGLAAAGAAYLDRPGLYAWWVDGSGAADLTRGLAPGRDLTVAFLFFTRTDRRCQPSRGTPAGV